MKILRTPENLGEDDIVLVLRKRNCEKRVYERNVELIFESSKKPSVDDLKRAVSKKIN